MGEGGNTAPVADSAVHAENHALSIVSIQSSARPGPLKEGYVGFVMTICKFEHIPP